MPIITLICEGLNKTDVLSAPQDILDEFLERPWYPQVQCFWVDKNLTLIIESDDDYDGQAALEEFWDSIHACINFSGEIDVSVKSIQA